MSKERKSFEDLNDINSHKFESDKKRKEKIEKYKRIEIKNKKQKENSLDLEKANLKFDLEKLEFLVKQGVLTRQTFDQILVGDIFEDETVKEIVSKIDEVIVINKKKKILPDELIILKEEYLVATKDEDQRIKVIDKVNLALDYLYQYHYGNTDSMIGGIFQLDSFGLNEDVIKVQETNIDIKNNLTKK